jgi:RNA polymerase-binding transcription factor
LNDIQRKIIKDKIIDTIEDIKDEVEELKLITGVVAPDRAIGRISRMDAINNRSINKSVLDNAEERLNQLQYALTKTDGNKFGICESCGAEININRLLSVPEAENCINCGS